MRPTCDGFDVRTPVGVLHFVDEPTEADVAAAIERLTEPVTERIEVIAEDGESL